MGFLGHLRGSASLILSTPRSDQQLKVMPGGRKLVTLRDAADYIKSLPKKESDLPKWQAAIEILMLVSRSGPTMMRGSVS
jgi:hypothetical protein